MWAARKTRATSALIVAALALCVAATSASACSCVRQHPAMFLPHAEAAIVGVVESRELVGSTATHVIRVERAVKGTFGERVTVSSILTSCQVSIDPGTRVGLFLNAGANGEWTTIACSMTDPDALLAAADLPAPSGTARLVAAVESATTDSVALTAGGKVAGYGLPDGAPLALARCGANAIQALRGTDGRVRVSARVAPRLGAAGAVEVPLKDVSALDCTGNTQWAIGTDGTLVSIRSGEARVESRRAGGAVAIAGAKAYFARRGRVDVMTLRTGRVRTVRHAGQFTQLSVQGERVAGRLRDGRGAVLALASGRLRTGGTVDGLAWLGRDRLLDAGNGTVLSGRLEVARRLSGRVGRLVGTDGATAYLADGEFLRRLRPGAGRAEAFAEAPGPVVGIVPVQTKATAAWHSCEKSAKHPLTT